MDIVERLTAAGARIFAWADGLQRRHGLLGFPYAVIKKYGDDEGGREAALITYYGFLSIFPLLLLGVAILSRVLVSDPDLRQRLITAIVPPVLQSTVEHALTTLPTSPVPLVAGLIGLLFAGTGIAFSAYQTLNHVAAVPRRLRPGFFSRYIRVFVMLATLMLGALAVGALTVAATALPSFPGAERAVAALGSAVIIFAVLLLAAKLLLARPAPFGALWPAAAAGAVAVAVLLSLAPPLLARFVSSSGAVYGSFATVAALFAVLYLISQALVYSAEIAAVRHAGLWPRAMDQTRPTTADVRAQTLLAREQERMPAARADIRLSAERRATSRRPLSRLLPRPPTTDRGVDLTPSIRSLRVGRSAAARGPVFGECLGEEAAALGERLAVGAFVVRHARGRSLDSMPVRETVHGTAIDREPPVHPGVLHLPGEGDDLIHRDVRIGCSVADQEPGVNHARVGGAPCGEAAVDADRRSQVQAGSGEGERGHPAEAVPHDREPPVGLGPQPGEPCLAALHQHGRVVP